ncbi:hypothetical protein GF366_00850 [Candidatus Peregrinibacteria bacterium]|nr:hypothetical protein [Candidatus Peregrinibacteria bacterium]
MPELIFLILGIAGLIIGTQLIIKGALNIAEHFKISHIFIGLTILAVGSDLPELVIDITGAIHRIMGTETSGLIVGETIGTCIGQIAPTLGIIGLLGTSLFLTKRETIREGGMLIGAVILLFLLGIDGNLSRSDGIIMLLSYGIYFVVLYRNEKKKERETKRAPELKVAWSVLSLITGFAILIFSSNVVINNAIALAKMWGVAQSFIGAIIVGFGTSLPEITVSLGALVKKVPRLSVGNLIGSNIFDILFTLGIGSTISGFLVEKNLLKFDIPFLFFTSLIVLIFFMTKKRLSRKESAILVIIYLIYLTLKIMGF